MKENHSGSRFIVNKTDQCIDPLNKYVRNAVENYFIQLEGHHTEGLYHMVMAEVEKPLLETVMRHVGSNQTKAATILGISRSTLRKKLAQYELA